MKDLNQSCKSFGFLESDIILILEAIKKFPEIKKASIYGSRAIGKNKKGSDVDIAIFGKKILHQTSIKLSVILNQELPLPYFFDITNYNSITNKELKKHIDTFGKTIYEKHF